MMQRGYTTVGLYEYNPKDLIGHGAFAVVYKGRVKTAPTDVVAIKAITKKNLAKSQNLLSKEIKILKELTELHHDNVVALLDCKETPHHVYLVMEYCNGGDLADYLNAKGTLSEDTIKRFLRQLAGAMSAMTSKGIVHRDLKPQNILLSHEGRTRNPLPADIKLKIADFGFARFLQDGVMAATLCGSPMYMAPEVIMSLQYDAKADLWSLGTIVFQCLTGKAPFQAQTPQALKQFYEKNAKLSPRIPSGTSPELTNLLHNLLKRDAKDRIDFDQFFVHPFLAPPILPKETEKPENQKERSSPEPVPLSRRHSNASSPPIPGLLPPSPAMNPPSTRMEAPSSRMDTSDHNDPRDNMEAARRSSGSSPENTDQESDFVIVPNSLTSENTRNKNVGISPLTARRIGSRPGSLPVMTHNTEPIPVPSQKAAFAAIQNSLITSRGNQGEMERNSVSAMSGVSSASGGSTLGLDVVPENEPLPSGGGVQPSPAMHRRPRASSMSGHSPVSSPRSPTKQFPSTKTRRVSAPPIACPISSLSPPQVQFTMGTPPAPHRRRTSSGSSSSCAGTPPNCRTVSPSNATPWTVSPGRATPTSSPLRRSGRYTPPCTTLPAPSLPPILGSPNRGSGQAPVMEWCDNNDNSDKTAAANGNLVASSAASPGQMRRVNTDLQIVPAGTARKTVVLNYTHTAPPGYFAQSQGAGGGQAITRRSSGCFDKENQFPVGGWTLEGGQGYPMPPPDLSEETLLAPEHNEVLAKLRFISMLVDTIISVARTKAAPLSGLTESAVVRGPDQDTWDSNSPLQRRLQQLLLYMRCLQLLSQTLDFSRAELKSKRLKPSTSVKNTLATLNERFRHCLSMSKMLNAENLLAESGIDPGDTTVSADKLLYHHAIEQCQSAALDELFNNPGECVQRYQAAHVLLHALQFQTGSLEDKNTLSKYKDAVEKRLHILEEQGYVYAYDTISN